MKSEIKRRTFLTAIGGMAGVAAATTGCASKLLGNEKPRESMENTPKGDDVYLFGYGSLINPESRAKTGISGEAIPVELTGLRRAWNYVRCKVTDKTLAAFKDQIDPGIDIQVLMRVLANLETYKEKVFRTREEWKKTLHPILERAGFPIDRFPSDLLFNHAAVGVFAEERAIANGVVVPVPKGSEIRKFDNREDGYSRKKLADLGVTEVRPLDGKKLPSDAIWVYVPENPREPAEDCPIAQCYVDVVLAGCLLQFGWQFAEKFVETTDLWECTWVDDRYAPRYSRATPYDGLATRIDKILANNIPKALARAPNGKTARREFVCGAKTTRLQSGPSR